MKRLQSASAVARRISVEAQVLESGATFDEPDLGIVKFVGVAGGGVELVERALQRRMLLGLEPALAEPRAGKTDRRAQHQGAGNEHRHERHQARARRSDIAIAGGPEHRLA